MSWWVASLLTDRHRTPRRSRSYLPTQHEGRSFFDPTWALYTISVWPFSDVFEFMLFIKVLDL